jgi:ribosome recycling factor
VLFNKFKETIRDIQNRHIRKLKKQEDTVSADLIFSVQNQIHTLAENIIQDAEKVMIAKQNELLGMKE